MGPLEVELLDANGVAIPMSSTGDIEERTPGEARLFRRSSFAGRFYVRVRASGAVSVPYSVEVFATFMLY